MKEIVYVGGKIWGKERLLVVYVCVWWIDDGGVYVLVQSLEIGRSK